MKFLVVFLGLVFLVLGTTEAKRSDYCYPQITYRAPDGSGSLFFYYARTLAYEKTCECSGFEGWDDEWPTFQGFPMLGNVHMYWSTSNARPGAFVYTTKYMKSYFFVSGNIPTSLMDGLAEAVLEKEARANCSAGRRLASSGGRRLGWSHHLMGGMAVLSAFMAKP